MAGGLFILALAPSYKVDLGAMVMQGFGAGFLVSNASLPLLLKLSARLRVRSVGGFTACLHLGQFASPLIETALAVPFGGMPQGLSAAIMAWASVTVILAVLWAAVGMAHSRDQPCFGWTWAGGLQQPRVWLTHPYHRDFAPFGNKILRCGGAGQGAPPGGHSSRPDFGINLGAVGSRRIHQFTGLTNL